MNVNAYVFLVKYDLGWQIWNIIETWIDKISLLTFYFAFYFFFVDMTKMFLKDRDISKDKIWYLWNMPQSTV